MKIVYRTESHFICPNKKETTYAELIQDYLEFDRIVLKLNKFPRKLKDGRFSINSALVTEVEFCLTGPIYMQESLPQLLEGYEKHVQQLLASSNLLDQVKNEIMNLSDGLMMKSRMYDPSSILFNAHVVAEWVFNDTREPLTRQEFEKIVTEDVWAHFRYNMQIRQEFYIIAADSLRRKLYKLQLLEKGPEKTAYNNRNAPDRLIADLVLAFTEKKHLTSEVSVKLFENTLIDFFGIDRNNYKSAKAYAKNSKKKYTGIEKLIS